MLPLYMRRALVLTGVLNAFGALMFMPFYTKSRQSMGLPEAHPFYLWLISLWIAGFGAVYLQLGLSGKPDRSFLTIGAIGKLSFALLLCAFWLTGDLPIAAPLSGIFDLVLGTLFVFYLFSSRHKRTDRPE